MLRSRRAQALVVLALFTPLFLFWDRALAAFKHAVEQEEEPT